MSGEQKYTISLVTIVVIALAIISWNYFEHTSIRTEAAASLILVKEEHAKVLTDIRCELREINTRLSRMEGQQGRVRK